jgi:hypothetical protein
MNKKEGKLTKLNHALPHKYEESTGSHRLVTLSRVVEHAAPLTDVRGNHPWSNLLLGRPCFIVISKEREYPHVAAE